MLFWSKRNTLDTAQSVDVIEGIVYKAVKPLGFRKYGRTLHRFVDGDISQVINFQCGQISMQGSMCVNLGIRVPESMERTFTPQEPLKKYYHEYECNIRTRLTSLNGGADHWYDLKKDPNKIGRDIVKKLEKLVLPVFDVLNSRDAILAHRAEYPAFDTINRHMIRLEEAMIYGRRGDIATATTLFNEYYQFVLAEYREVMAHGRCVPLPKGDVMMYRNTKTGQVETVVGDASGEVTVFDANDAHLTVLENLAETLKLPLNTDRLADEIPQRRSEDIAIVRDVGQGENHKI